MSLEDGSPEPAAPAMPAKPAAPAKRKHPRWLLLLEILTVVAVVAPFIAFLIATNLGSSGAGGSSQVTVRNDGGATVTVQDCPPGCASPAQVVLTPGSSTQVSVAKGGTTYYVLDRAGALSGCLALSPTERSPVQLSTAGACSGHR
ncbi:MAG TPA: hypothetical protein VHA57_08835 [Actinomycetota bacterium]|nr:hypothetical protein [Actinomycetota bacterium]